MAKDRQGNLEGKQIVVTGWTGGLGPAVVAALIEAGATCHLPHRGDAPPTEAPGGDRVRLIPQVDLTDEGAVTRFYGQVPALWASVHVAGGFAAAPLVDTSLRDFRLQLDINLTTAFLCCREAVRGLRQKGEGPGAGGGGRIVNVSSRAALERKGGAIAYSVAKAGVLALTECLADEVKGDGILVNAVVPSIIDTPANRRAMPHAAHDQWPRPEQIAAAIVWLCSPENQLVSGAALPVYGVA
jgi:NAD(P)-dependent dehydrogenase (short-subunit alcohol dehydrogenase family)